MKQGTASHSGMSATKVEPKPMAINPGGVAQLGTHVGKTSAIEPIHAGRGFTAPKPHSTSHHCGSQGKR